MWKKEVEEIKITMEQILMKPVVLLMLVCTRVSYSHAQDYLLRNPDFENGTSRLSPLDPISSDIPGWSFAGTVYHVTSDNGSSSFPASGGHAIQLAENGAINQTLRIKGTEVMDYVLSFNLAAPNQDCASEYNRTTIAVNITAYRPSGLQTSKVFFYRGRAFSRRLWESNAFYFGQLSDKDYVNLEIKSHVTDDDNHNGTSNCWPLVDDFIVKRNHLQLWYSGNFLSNGDFEVGPSFLKNSYEGILLNHQHDTVSLPLQEWTILGTIRYIDSKHYRVPQGKAAIELLSESGGQSGIEIDLYLRMASTYTLKLNFTMGDANNSCVGDFVLYLEIRENVQNFTMRSRGKGSSFRHSVTIKGEPSLTASTIRFYSLNETRTSDGVLCGPVLDEIGVFGSDEEVVSSGVSSEMVNIHIFVVLAALFYFILLN